jgi:hypothetical protein
MPTADQSVHQFFASNFTQTKIKVVYIMAAIIAIGYYLFCLWYCNSHKDSPTAKLLVVSWVLGPPLWFYFEYIVLMGNFGQHRLGLQRPATIEGFKYTQDLSAKLWVAAASILFYVAGMKIG